MTEPTDVVRIDAVALTESAAATFAAAGCAPDEAWTVADGLVEANLFGHDSHGIGLLPRYVDNLRQGITRAGQSARIVADHGALVGMDGGKGFGQVVGEQAMAIAIERARATGVCVAGLANAHHLARIGRWAEQCADAGFASVHFVNVLSRPLVAPWGGTDARLATDPFCVGVPHAPHPLVLDYATSMVAMGKVDVALAAGRPMAEGLLMDASGRPTTDPAVMFGDPPGALLPFGQHKGFALSVMCEILGGALSGGHVQHEHPHPNPILNNMLSIVFAPDKLVTRDALARQVGQLAAWLRGSPLAPGATGIHLPGEPERITARERTREGIPLPRRTLAALADCARALGVVAFDEAAGAAAGGAKVRR
ncbi:MAG: malate/lactate/ureidoglycolate dehydrogenase [Burkholderiales bacterium]